MNNTNPFSIDPPNDQDIPAIRVFPATPHPPTPHRSSPNNTKTKPHRSTQKITVSNPRQGRVITRKSADPSPEQYYGSPIEKKDSMAVRIFMQNTKGLTYTLEGTDYEYYFRSRQEIKADVASLVETNTAWQHYYLRGKLTRCARQIRDTKINFSYPTEKIDPAGPKETFQAGGTVTAVMGALTYTVFGDDHVNDTTGLGRWSGCAVN
jgi:hypothetical protein